MPSRMILQLYKIGGGIHPNNRGATLSFASRSRRLLPHCQRRDLLLPRPAVLPANDFVPGSPRSFSNTAFGGGSCDASIPPPPLALQMQRLRRRMFASSSNNNNSSDSPLTATKERLTQDHNYCVDMVRDRDREGYCKLMANYIQLWRIFVSLVVSYPCDFFHCFFYFYYICCKSVSFMGMQRYFLTRHKNETTNYPILIF